MSDNLRDRIVAVQAEHVEDQLTNYDAGRNECGCGHQGNATFREHLADAVIEALPVIKALPQQVEWRADFGYDGYAKCETRDEARVRVDEFNAALGDDVRDGEQAMVMHRFVTDWCADE